MGNQMAQALINAKLAEPLKKKKKREGKPVICRKCGKPMTKMEGTNLAVCQNVDCEKISYIVFNR